MIAGPAVVQRVQWGDVDKMDIMYYAAYLRHTDAAEAAFFRALGLSYDGLHAAYGIWLARVKLDVRYRAPARLDDELTTQAQLLGLGASSLQFRFTIDRVAGATRLADVELTLAAIDASTRKAARLPAALRAALAGGERPDAS